MSGVLRGRGNMQMHEGWPVWPGDGDREDGLEAKDTEDWQESPETQAFKET